MSAVAPPPAVPKPLPSRFFARPWPERLAALQAAGLLSPQDNALLATGAAQLTTARADAMIENVIGVLGLPLAVGLNLVVDGRAVVVPMATEEASIVAAVSSAAKVAQSCGGFTTEMARSWLTGEIQVLDVDDAAAAAARVRADEDQIMAAARALQPRMVARGGGMQAMTVTAVDAAAPLGDSAAEASRYRPGPMLLVHLHVDTCDAMGANSINSLCEAIAPLVARLAGGTPGLRILSNLADHSMVRARCILPETALAQGGHSGAQVMRGILNAAYLAEVDIYRAVTHNKGVMNGIDAVALATGNDWRAIEAGAHAHAGRGPGYAPLTRWWRNADGHLVGEISLPLKVGICGGNFAANPTVALALRLLAPQSAQELARIMAAVGLAQNFAALRALGTSGIQSGHMRLHARSVVASTGCPPALFDAAVTALVDGGDIRLDAARPIIASLRAAQSSPAQTGLSPQAVAARPQVERVGEGHGFGKLIVCGEHAVVYGSHALAVPLALATGVRVRAFERPGVQLTIPAWGINQALTVAGAQGDGGSLHQSLRLILQLLNVPQDRLHIEVQALVPRAMGLGSSAALAVACVRALSAFFELNLPEAQIIATAFEAEKVAHGTPSGVDNALATLGCPLLFRRATAGAKSLRQSVGAPLHWVVGLTHTQSLTATTVRQVREAHAQAPGHYNKLFAAIDDLTLEAAAAMSAGDALALGRLMDLNHGLLHALQISTAQLEALVHLARGAGALGAKVTGGGGGGSMLALCADADSALNVAQAMDAAGYRALTTTTEVTHA